jgi:hypothetical protein
MKGRREGEGEVTFENFLDDIGDDGFMDVEPKRHGIHNVRQTSKVHKLHYYPQLPDQGLLLKEEERGCKKGEGKGRPREARSEKEDDRFKYSLFHKMTIDEFYQIWMPRVSHNGDFSGEYCQVILGQGHLLHGHLSIGTDLRSQVD